VRLEPLDQHGYVVQIKETPMTRWQWFSFGIVAGLLAAVGFGFAGSGQKPVPEEMSYLPPTAPEPFPDDGKLRIIAFGAHPDDCEIRVGGSGMLWSKQGHHVKFVSVTNGDIGHWQMAGGPLAQRRYSEVQAAANILGVTTDVLDIHDGELEPTLQNRRTITRLIRGWQADVVISHRPNDYHPDHRYTGVLVQDSAYMVAVPFFCPDTPPVRGNPVFLYSEDGFERPNPFRADIVVAIDEVIDQKVEALLVMESQFVEGGALGYLRPYDSSEEGLAKRREQAREGFKRRAAHTADRFRDKLVELYGPEQGKLVKYAEAFEVCEYGRRPSKEEIRKLFPFYPKVEP
jgi:LmbE family N-acetylglucosaminyl deacetylase